MLESRNTLSTLSTLRDISYFAYVYIFIFCLSVLFWRGFSFNTELLGLREWLVSKARGQGNKKTISFMAIFGSIRVEYILRRMCALAFAQFLERAASILICLTFILAVFHV